jgi:hypothetical protein
VLRRLLLILVPTVFVLVAAVLIPLGTVVAGQRTQEMYVDRLGDAGRFAALARTALDTGRVNPLALEMARYEELYGIPVPDDCGDGEG